MLKELYIKNMAVIDELRIQFQNGFQVLTGETGAGKTILVESIGLILGNKATGSLIRDGAEEAVVEACFDISENPELQDLLHSESLQNSEAPYELVIKRLLASSGQNKIYINYQKVSLSFLQQISALLIDFTGQHEQMKLLDSSNDVLVLDSFLDDQGLIKKYQNTYREAKELQQQISDTKKLSLQKGERLEWLKFQLKDFDQLKIRSEAEEAEFRQWRERLKNGEAISQFERMASQSLSEGQGNCVGAIRNLMASIEKTPALSSVYQGLLAPLEQARILLEDLSYEISKASAQKGVNADLSFDDVESALHQLETLKRKFGPEVSDVLKRRTEIETEIGLIESSDFDVERLEKQFSALMHKLKDEAQALSDERLKVKKLIERRVKNELVNLMMPNVQFEVDIRTKSGEPLQQLCHYNIHGTDDVAFLISPNPGLAPRSLAKIASGGETSRIFLALKKVLLQKKKGRTLIFDEIDTGISGAAVELVGHKLKDLARSSQVFCVTHHAQIASQADQHYVVHKQTANNKTITRVKVLSDNDRINEVARLMGGVKVSSKNLAFAAEMVAKKKLQ